MGGGSPHGCERRRDAAGDIPDPGSAAGPADQRLRLQAALEDDYDGLVHRLSNTLRSNDKAAEALHDAYVRLSGSPVVGEVRNPLAYLYRMALNLAHNIRIRELRLVDLPPEAERALVDEGPGPERTALARMDAEKALAALDALPAQRRAIFLARWRDELSHDEIARLFHVHKRTVQKELAKAERFLHGVKKLSR